MAKRNTRIRGAQILAAVAGGGLKFDASENLELDLNELSAASVDVAADSVAIVDATDSSTKKEAIADIITAVAGVGLVATSGVMAVDINEISEVAVDVSADLIAIEDATDNSTKKESIADLATAMAGTGITATDGVLSADSVSDNIVEGDIQKEDESATCDGNETTFTLSNTPLANSVQVYLDGLLQQEGSGNDYILSGTTVTFAIAPESGSLLIVYYIIDNA